MYGLETAQFNNTTRNKLDVFQLKGLRQICKITTTFINREHDNRFVYETAERLSEERGKKRLKIIPLSEQYEREK